MVFFRRALARFVFASLLGQAATVALVAGVFWVEATAVECTCSHGDHATCPMHHRTPPRSKSGCAMRQAADLNLAVIPALLGTCTPAPVVTAFDAPVWSPATRLTASTVPIALSAPPDSPPPRA